MNKTAQQAFEDTPDIVPVPQVGYVPPLQYERLEDIPFDEPGITWVQKDTLMRGQSEAHIALIRRLAEHQMAHATALERVSLLAEQRGGPNGAIGDYVSLDEMNEIGWESFRA